MQSFVLIGERDKQESYISSFIQEKNIPKYFVYRFEDTLKIAEVRLLKKNISFTIPKNSFRLFVLPVGITVDAQNALLKTIEELGEETFIFFLTNTSETLLPTILSRSKIVRLGFFEVVENTNSMSWILTAKNKKEMMLPALQLCDKISSKNGIEEIENILLTLRREIRSQLCGVHLGSSNLASIVCIALEIQNTLPLLVDNNINKKLALENIFLSQF